MSYSDDMKQIERSEDNVKECGLCGKQLHKDDSCMIYDEEDCHVQCAFDDMDFIGMDSDFGASG